MHSSLDFRGWYVPSPFAKIEITRIISSLPHKKIVQCFCCFFFFLSWQKHFDWRDYLFPSNSWNIKLYSSKSCSSCLKILSLLSTEYYYSSGCHAYLRNRKAGAREKQGVGLLHSYILHYIPKMGVAISYKILRNSYQNRRYYIPKIILVIVNIA